ncbi:MAG: DUF4339 domain-containing protein [Planctomycetes bacterium]|nr:DUF4339 domain-containing protein [Planctomycetota bacterium]
MAEPARSKRSKVQTPEVVGPRLGPSVRYHCSECGERYESLRAPRWEQGRCPRCGTVNRQAVKSVIFPRPQRHVEPYEDSEALGGDDAVARQAQKDADAVDAEIDGAAELDMRDDCLVARPARSVAPDADIIDGRLIDEEADLAGAMPVDMEAGASPFPEPGAPQTGPEDSQASASSDEAPAWSYLMKGKKHGPISKAELMDRLAAGHINPSVLVYHDGMDGWHPVEDVDELAAALETAPAVTDEADQRANEPVPLPPAVVRPSRDVADACSRMIWLFMAGASLTVLLAVTRDTFYNIGSRFMLGTGLVLATLLAVGAAYGLVLLVRSREVIRRLAGSARTQAILGTGGLVACMAVAVALAVTPQQTSAMQADDEGDSDIAQAKVIFNALSSGEEGAAEQFVALSRLDMFGEDFGERFRALDDPGQQSRETWRLLSEFKTRCNPIRMPAEQISGWRVLDRDLDSAYVSVPCPASPDQRLYMRIENGLLTELSLGTVETPDGEAE